MCAKTAYSAVSFVSDHVVFQHNEYYAVTCAPITVCAFTFVKHSIRYIARFFCRRISTFLLRMQHILRHAIFLYQIRLVVNIRATQGPIFNDFCVWDTLRIFSSNIVFTPVECTCKMFCIRAVVVCQSMLLNLPYSLPNLIIDLRFVLRRFQ